MPKYLLVYGDVDQSRSGTKKGTNVLVQRESNNILVFGDLDSSETNSTKGTKVIDRPTTGNNTASSSSCQTTKMAGQQSTGGRVTYYQVRNAEHAMISEIFPGLYISGICALKPSTMKEYDITMIINATTEVPNSASLGKISRMKLWLEDSSDAWVLSYLDYICDKILKIMARGGKVLIHSVQGVSRCATICLAFLTKYKFKTLRDAYFYLASIRPKVDPNIGFWRQLISFEQELKQTMGSVRIVRDQNNPSVLIPDVYRKYVLQRRKLRQIQHQGNIRTEQSRGPLEIPQGSFLDHSDQENGRGERKPFHLPSSNAAAVSTMETAAMGEADATDDIAALVAGLAVQRAWSKKSHTPQRKNSLSKKFLPVLEPVTEVVEATA